MTRLHETLPPPTQDEALAEGRALLQAGRLEAGLAALEEGCRRFPDALAEGGAPLFGLAYVEAVLAAWDGGPQTTGRRLALQARLVGLIDRHPGLVLPRFQWLDFILRSQRQFGGPVRTHLWNRAVVHPAVPFPHLLRLVSFAFHARTRETLRLAAAPLRGRLAARLAAHGAEDVPVWCQLADIHLLEDELDAAEACYRTAIGQDAGCARAVAGLACVALGRGAMELACGLATRAADLLREAGEAEAAAAIDGAVMLWSRRLAVPAPASLEVVFFCHVSGKLHRNAHLGAPGLGLLEAAVRSLRQSIELPEGVPMTVFYDHRDTAMNRAFLANLMRFCEAEGLGLVINTEHGLRRQWLHAFGRGTAELVMVVEQDHEFIPPGPSLAGILDLFARRPDINQLRLNRRPNVAVGFDALLAQAAQDKADGVTITARFSNTPQFLRRDFYAGVVLPRIDHDIGNDGRNQGAGGVEDNINPWLRRLEAVIGVPAVMRLAGLAIWGQPGDEARCAHLGV
jgi:tetratricopeptide (TPR) repeat protein